MYAVIKYWSDRTEGDEGIEKVWVYQDKETALKRVEMESKRLQAENVFEKPFPWAVIKDGDKIAIADNEFAGLAHLIEIKETEKE